MSTHYTVCWCFFHTLCLYQARRSKLHPDLCVPCSLDPQTWRIPSVCCSIFVLLVSILNSWWSVNWFAHPMWQMYSKKSFGIYTLSCNEGCMRLRPEWPWRGSEIKNFPLEGSVQHWNLFLFPPPFAIVLFDFSSDECWGCTRSFRRYSFFYRIQLFWHWVIDWRIIFWLNISPLSFPDG